MALMDLKSIGEIMLAWIKQLLNIANRIVQVMECKTNVW